MFLSVATTHQPATDLGFLLHKHPERVHRLPLGFGEAWLVYPQAEAARCEAALILDVDPVGLVRGRGGREGLVEQYVNDRPYAASSLLSVALNKMLRTAMAGASRERPELAEAAIPLEAVVTPLPVRGDADLVERLFAPLGWQVAVDPVATMAARARHVRLTLSGMTRLSTLLNHLYVLIPVLDDAKHYWVGEAEVDKLLARGAGWLETHPARDLIVRRYLKNRGDLSRDALSRLAPEEAVEREVRSVAGSEEGLESPIRLNDQRMEAVAGALRRTGARAIVDLGCGEGRLLQRLLREPWAERLWGVDPSSRELDRAAHRLKLNTPGGQPDSCVRLLHGSLSYRDARWAEADAAALVEVVEHLDPERLPMMEAIVFGDPGLRSVVVTTPNVEHNVRFRSLESGAMRHPDHRFEWTRAEFRDWAERLCVDHRWRVVFDGVGGDDAEVGAPTQMAVFTR